MRSTREYVREWERETSPLVSASGGWCTGVVRRAGRCAEARSEGATLRNSSPDRCERMRGMPLQLQAGPCLVLERCICMRKQSSGVRADGSHGKRGWWIHLAAAASGTVADTRKGSVRS